MNRIAVVSGGASGIGRAIVARLHADRVRCAVLDLDPTPDLPPEDFSLRCDIADSDAVRAAATRIRAELGPPNVLVHCAARQATGPFAEVTEDDWAGMMRVNVDGGFHLAQAFLPAMREAGWGRVVMVTSSSLFATPAGMVAYVTSKGALLGLVRGLAAEVGPDGVTVNAVAPGLTNTGRAVRDLPAEHFATVLGRQAVKRTGEPMDSAAAVSFLASADASFITGQTLLVDGGESHT
ncbi:MAG TPA: SDR family oxidoreductase [Pseudonocardiaceae bacterium]|jgi:NAD(P)-dependent dehydrogenase (short-subunit alcohol dehydrogenase family)|nr:SDR family oxidoreductase [Pseudonocardiaceae bacterium]